MGQLYTIGCSVLSLDTFIYNLITNEINVIADVRSIPYSKTTPQFNKEELMYMLKKERILYMDFSREFGARRSELYAYIDNQVSFDKTKELPIFLDGVKRIEKGLSLGYKIALMCTEKNPLDCHRFSLVARGIYEKTGITCLHVLGNGLVKETGALEQEMLKEFNLEQDLFLDEQDRLKQGYKLLNKKIGYTLSIK